MKKTLLLALMLFTLGAFAQKKEEQILLNQLVRDTTFTHYLKSAGFKSSVRLVYKNETYSLGKGDEQAIEVTDIQLVKDKKGRFYNASTIMYIGNMLIKLKPRNLIPSVDCNCSNWYTRDLSFQKSGGKIPFLAYGTRP